jgi:PAS domain S-box-containing protein
MAFLLLAATGAAACLLYAHACRRRSRKLAAQLAVLEQSAHAADAGLAKAREQLVTAEAQRERSLMEALKRSEDELRQREILFLSVFEHAPFGISWKRSDTGAVCHVNAAFRRILDLPADVAPDGALLAGLANPDDLPRYRGLQCQIESGQSDAYVLEMRFVPRNGREVWGRLSVAVVRGEAGRIVQETIILEDITVCKQTGQELAESRKALTTASRAAAMAEIATGVVHNVGNVINSVNVSVNVVAESLRQSHIGSVAKLSTLLHEHAGDLGAFLSTDPRGQRILPYLDTLAEHLGGEQKRLRAEIESLRGNLDHIKDIVSMQQSYAKVAGVEEMVPPSDLFADAFRLNAVALSRHDIEVVREFAPTPLVRVERNKVIQILINVIQNAKYALDESGRSNRRLVLRTETAVDKVRFIITDNGVGIPPENIGRIFSHGFTTRKDGHGFGLHSAILTAQEMGGTLKAQSDGPGRGASFILELPCAPKASEPGGEGSAPALHA